MTEKNKPHNSQSYNSSETENLATKTLRIPVKQLDITMELPAYAYPGDAGFDLRSSKDLEIPPKERAIVPCGFSMAIPEGYAGFVMPRSGLAAKHGITVLNTPGLIDSGYRGEICVILYNTDSHAFKIKKTDRIAQMVIVPFAQSLLFPVTDLNNSERSQKGFGSSGV